MSTDAKIEEIKKQLRLIRKALEKISDRIDRGNLILIVVGIDSRDPENPRILIKLDGEGAAILATPIHLKLKEHLDAVETNGIDSANRKIIATGSKYQVVAAVIDLAEALTNPAVAKEAITKISLAMIFEKAMKCNVEIKLQNNGTQSAEFAGVTIGEETEDIAIVLAEVPDITTSRLSNWQANSDGRIREGGIRLTFNSREASQIFTRAATEKVHGSRMSPTELVLRNVLG